MFCTEIHRGPGFPLVEVIRQQAVFETADVSVTIAADECNCFLRLLPSDDTTMGGVNLARDRTEELNEAGWRNDNFPEHSI